MNWFFGFLVLAFTQGAFAAETTLPIQVRCEANGPVYAGTLKMDNDLNQWKKIGRCERMPIVRPVWEQKFEVPSMEIAFNGIVFKSSSKDEPGVFQFENGDCSWKSLMFISSIRAHAEGGYLPIYTDFNITDMGLVGSSFKFNSDVGYCRATIR